MANGDFEFKLTGSTYKLQHYNGSAANVNIPSSYNGKKVTAIGPYVFYAHGEIRSVTIPNTVTCIENFAFKSSGIESIVLPDSVTQIGSGVFEECLSLKSVKLSNKIKRIENSAFWQCIELDGVILPKSLTEIGQKAFYECKALTSIEIPASVIVIEDDAFHYCGGLKRVVFANPDGWYLAANPSDGYGQELSAEELGYPPEAAKLLQKYFTYGNYWKRK